MTADHRFDLNSTIRDGGWDTIGDATRRNILNDALGIIRTDAGSGVWVTDSSYSYYNGNGLQSRGILSAGGGEVEGGGFD
ncbi:MAG: hypothetical protein ABW000_15795 [Actinoplanes sp.]